MKRAWTNASPLASHLTRPFLIMFTVSIPFCIRHPMYSALALYSIGQALVIPNWVAGPSNLLAFAILFALRVHAEERMIVKEFGDEYEVYSARTKRLIPGVR